jgi:hypothetical protein
MRQSAARAPLSPDRVTSPYVTERHRPTDPCDGPLADHKKTNLDPSTLTHVSSVETVLVGDYDEPLRRIRLRKSVTKTRAALWVELPEVLAEAIEATLPHRKFRNPDASLISDVTADRLPTAIARACKANGIPVFSPHDLRHRRGATRGLRFPAKRASACYVRATSGAGKCSFAPASESWQAARSTDAALRRAWMPARAKHRTRPAAQGSSLRRRALRQCSFVNVRAARAQLAPSPRT